MVPLTKTTRAASIQKGVNVLGEGIDISLFDHLTISGGSPEELRQKDAAQVFQGRLLVNDAIN